MSRKRDQESTNKDRCQGEETKRQGWEFARWFSERIAHFLRKISK